MNRQMTFVAENMDHLMAFVAGLYIGSTVPFVAEFV